jgi:hypothetical protein
MPDLALYGAERAVNDAYPRQKMPDILPIFKADKVTLQVSRQEDGKLRLVHARLSRTVRVVATHRIGALFVSADRFLVTHSEQIVTLASWTAVPAAYGWRQAVTRGGLMSYGTDFHDS